MIVIYVGVLLSCLFSLAVPLFAPWLYLVFYSFVHDSQLSYKQSQLFSSYLPIHCPPRSQESSSLPHLSFVVSVRPPTLSFRRAILSQVSIDCRVEGGMASHFSLQGVNARGSVLADYDPLALNYIVVPGLPIWHPYILCLGKA